ncbi:CHAD domain-containing protein [Sulfurimonas sp.]|uniref:CHAD domain-containing protein n=1 Tax=Sulfurimonas sp. TaxID=2022749 RepID=UPI0025D60B29|nr:CHAD domain-containing protein [Sulfurimonas sp.]
MKFRMWFESRVSLVSEMHTQLLLEDEIELLHKYRVNLRKLYACSETYVKNINKHSSKKLSKLIKKLLKPTALLRDVDLFLIEIQTLKCSNVSKVKLDAIMKKKRENAFKILMQTLCSDEYKKSLKLLIMMTKETEFFVYETHKIDVHKIISEVEKSRYEELSCINMQTSFDSLHNLRKEFKKFRYALDIYEQCFSHNKDMNFDFVKLKRLQGFFGEIQDNFVRLELVKSVKEELDEAEYLEFHNNYELKLFTSKKALFKNFDIL